jgi:hypothetical protein
LACFPLIISGVMKLIRPLDYLIIAIILIVASSAIFLFKGTTGAKAEIYVKKKKIAVFSLLGPEKIKEIDTRIGKIQLLVGKGSIRVLKSPCKQKICILQGDIQNTHESIICLPGEMAILIINTDDSENPLNQIDAISH